MRDLDQLLLLGAVAVAANGEEPCGDQRLHQAMRIRWQLRQPRRLPHALTVFQADAHEVRHEGVAQCGKLPRRRPQAGDRLVGHQPHRVLDRVEAALRVAQRLVFGDGQLVVAAAAAIEQPQRVRQERQRLGVLDVAGDAFRQALFDIDAGDGGGSFDQSRHTVERHQRQREGLGQLPEVAGRDQAFQHVGAAGRDHQERNVPRRVEYGAHQAQECVALLGGRDGEHLFELVDRQQHRGVASIRRCAGP